ncbi:hypothetical protein RN001_008060 [Aquatica leii]|uniref:Uncharacterized protein n=1 Tax=Aquatica leii TaxID=1421715 RepID=A0AAN7SH43_9COLE|nr:hypothetical protein RN001_008060 [Aquatica leii]
MRDELVKTNYFSKAKRSGASLRGKSVSVADLSESSDSEIELSLHDSISSIGSEGFEEEEPLPDEGYQEECKGEDKVEEDEIEEMKSKIGIVPKELKSMGFQSMGDILKCP